MEEGDLFEKVERPTIITIICVVGFVGVPITILMLLIPTFLYLMVEAYGIAFIPLTLISSILSLAGLIGYWKMKRWGLYVYGFSAIASIIASIFLGIGLNFGQIVPIAIALLGVYYFKDMD